MKIFLASNGKLEYSFPVMRNYQVIVGNVGKVYDGSNEFVACQTYDEYVILSEQAAGRASGEDVTLILGDKIVREHVGFNNSNE